MNKPNLKPGNTYEVTKQIKIHTKPTYTVNCSLSGRFVKETKFYYVFDSFRVQKSVVIKIEKTN